MSCFGGDEEQLYLLELLVDRLKIPEEKFKDAAVVDGSECPLVVKMKFLDFPAFEISQKDFYFTRPAAAPEDDGSRDFSAGRTCLFVRKPKVLVREMQSSPLKIGIFCAGDTYPLAETEVPLSGCLCNQVSMASNDADHLPPPYVLRGGYNLKDSGGNPSGTINLELRLSCFGKSVTTHYQLSGKSFLFKNDRDDGNYCVKRVLPPTFCGDQAGRDTMKCGDSMLPSTLVDEEVELLPADTKKPDNDTADGNGKTKKKKNGNKNNKKGKKKK